ETPGKPANPNANDCVTKVVARFDGGVEPAKYKESGRPGSNRRRPAWEAEPRTLAVLGVKVCPNCVRITSPSDAIARSAGQVFSGLLPRRQMGSDGLALRCHTPFKQRVAGSIPARLIKDFGDLREHARRNAGEKPGSVSGSVSEPVSTGVTVQRDYLSGGA